MLLALALLVAPQSDAEGHRPIFDGRSLDGWRGDPSYWYVRDGVLVGESTAVRPCSEATCLVWEAGELGDFEMRFEVRRKGGGAGVRFRSERVGDFRCAGYRADLAGTLEEEGGRGTLARRGQKIRLLPAGGHEVESFDDAGELLAHVPDGEWNHYAIRATGTRIELEINGHLMCEALDEDRAAASLQGALALELQAGPPTRVEFKNLWLKELPRAEPEPPGEREPSGAPEWIWASAEALDYQQVWLRKTFVVPGAVRAARLVGSCDDRFNAWLNGELVAAGDEWWEPEAADLDAGDFRGGRNALAVWGQNEAGPAGMWLELEIELEDGSELALRSDATWRSAGAERDAWQSPETFDGDWPLVHSFGPWPVSEWGSQGEAADEGLREALAAEELELPAGFRAELLYSVPNEQQGSWVCATFDGAGRLIASDQYGALYRVVPPPLGSSEGTEVQRLDLEVGEAQGMLWAFDSLYVVVNGHGRYASGLYRVRDADGDGELDAVELLRPLDGEGEHGPHAVVLAPDGDALYVIAGNHTHLPELAQSRVPRVWAEDALLPRLSDPGGHAVGVMAPGGWVCRTDPEGEEWELFAAGMRNAYDIDFDQDGELFTFDSDMEWDTGLPWYRPTRILHLVSGADYGWRHGSGKWPASYPDSHPGVVDIGLSSPTGVVFGTGTSFPARYRRALFAADWAYGALYAVHLEPAGASYTGEFEAFARGTPFPVTDVAVGPDGALYVTTGGRRVQSGLYRIQWVGALGEGEAPRPDLEALAARRIRHELEGYHLHGADEGSRDAESLFEILPFLGDPDRFLRSAARIAIEQRPIESWLEPASTLGEPLAKIQVALAVARTGGPEQADRVLAHLLRLDLGVLGEATLLEALRAVGLVCLRLGPPEAALGEELVVRLEELFPTGRDVVDRELARLLVFLGSSDVVEPALRLLAAAAGQEAALDYAYALRLAQGWTLEERRRYFEFLDGPALDYEGGASLRGYVEKIRADALEQLTEGERVALADCLAPAPASEARMAAAPVAPFAEGRVNEEPWELTDLAPHLAELAAGRSFERGEAAFRRATCSDCHRIGREGGSTGPDLTGCAGRFSARDLLEAILEPSKVLSDQYQDTELLTAEDQLVVGRVLREEDGVITLLSLPPDEREVELESSSVVLRRPHPLSRMPRGLVDGLTREELLDLLAYTLAGGSSSHPAFRNED